MAKIAKVFDVSTDYLMGVTDHPHNASPAFAVILREFLEDTPSALEEICKQTGISASVIEQYAAGAEEPSGGRMRVIHEAMKSLGWRPRLVGNAPKGKGRAPVFDVPNSRGGVCPRFCVTIHKRQNLGTDSCLIFDFERDYCFFVNLSHRGDFAPFAFILQT